MASSNNKPANVNERTYQEVEYLKKNLGPILVAALAEICIRRPADPIEYLGHWLLRWRYNEELKRRDVQNALDVVRQKQWAQAQDEGKPELFSQGVTPGHPYGPPGYGGPLDADELGEGEGEAEVFETSFQEEEGEEGDEYEGEGQFQGQGYLQGPGSEVEGEQRRGSQGPDDGRKASLPEGERRASGGPEGQELKVSGTTEERKTSLEGHRKTSTGAPEAEPRKASLPPADGARKLSESEGARKGSLGQPPTEEARKASLGAPPAEEPRRASIGPVPSGERKTSLGPEGARKASLGPGPEAPRKVSDPAPAVEPDGPRKSLEGERKGSLGQDRRASTGAPPQ